jgi:hypothetical protein
LSTAEDSGAALDREIPFHYYPFGVLRRFDIPDLLASLQIGGKIVDPIDGDWEALDLDVARKILPENLKVVKGSDLETLTSF